MVTTSDSMVFELNHVAQLRCFTESDADIMARHVVT